MHIYCVQKYTTYFYFYLFCQYGIYLAYRLNDILYCKLQIKRRRKKTFKKNTRKLTTNYEAEMKITFKIILDNLYGPADKFIIIEIFHLMKFPSKFFGGVSHIK